ncbi:hypothetical protein J7L68_00345 [bacterium]|nr:hypothetical protein [bacterium]
MKRAIFFLFISLFSLSIIFGQMAPGVFNPFSGLSSPDKAQFGNGAWIEYKTISNDKDESGRMKFSIVGEEERDGRKCHWFEIEMWNDNGDHTISKMLVSGDLSQSENRTMSMIIKSNDEPAYEFDFDIPTDSTRVENESQPDARQENIDYTQNYQASDDRTEVKTDEQTITVAAGTFKCKHITAVDKETGEKSEMWFSSKVPLVTIVKMKSADMEMELLKYGASGAKSAITETPQKINFQNMMNRPPQQENNDENDEGVKDAIKGSLKSIFGK